MMFPEQMQGKLPYKEPVPYVPLAWYRADCTHERCRAFLKVEFAVGPDFTVTQWVGVN